MPAVSAPQCPLQKAGSLQPLSSQTQALTTCLKGQGRSLRRLVGNCPGHVGIVLTRTRNADTARIAPKACGMLGRVGALLLILSMFHCWRKHLAYDLTGGELDPG